MYDVFLSHNRREKPWVRQLSTCLTEHGLRVFFDDESIRPGESVVHAIEKGLTGSRHVLLVISSASIASRWVALETQMAIHGDPDASGNTVIPVIVDKLDWEKVRPAVRSLSAIDLSDPGTRLARLTRLFVALGVSPNAGRLQELSDALAPSLGVAGIGDVLDWGWSGERLLEEFIALDYKTLDGLVEMHEGSPSQWAPVFMNHPDTWRMLVSDREQVQGYWHFAPLFPEDYGRAKLGLLLDSEITADRVRMFELPGMYDVYFVQLCLHQRFRHLTHVRQLFRSILDVFEELAASGVFIREVCANAYTPVGHSICRSAGMTRVGDHAEHGTIFAGSIADVLESQLGGMNGELKRIYQSSGLVSGGGRGLKAPASDANPRTATE